MLTIDSASSPGADHPDGTARTRVSPATWRSNLVFAAVLCLIHSVACRANPYLDHYALDPAFNGAVALDDRFATGPDTPHYAEKTVVLNDGTVVVAGLVPTASQTGNIVGGNIGLVQYTAGGGRTGWANPDPAYASYYNIYITYPNSPTALFSHIVDMKVVGSYLYILADYAYSSSDKDVYVVVFGLDGSFVGQYAAFTTGLYEFSAGLVTYAYPVTVKGVTFTRNQVIAVASYDSGDIAPGEPHWVVTMKRFTIGSGGALSVDTSFGHVGNGAADQPLPLDFCGPYALNPCSGSAAHVAAVRTNTSAPAVYIYGNAATYGNQAKDTFIMAVDGSSGDLLTSFGTNGIYDQAVQGATIYYGGSNKVGPAVDVFAVATGADASGDVVYVTAQNNAFTACSNYGAAITKVRASSGPPLYVTAPDFAWGVGGTATVAARADCSLSGYAAEAAHLYPSAVAQDGSRIAVTGSNGNGEPVFTAVRFADGVLMTYEVVPWLRGDGSRWENFPTVGGLDSGFEDVASAGNGRFAVTGTICDATAATACALFGTEVLHSDEIFGNGYD